MTDKQRQAYDEWLRSDASDPADVPFAAWTASRKLALEEAEDQIPTSWLDPLLTGGANVVGDPPFGCPDVELLLSALRKRIAAIRQQQEEGNG